MLSGIITLKIDIEAPTLGIMDKIILPFSGLGKRSKGKICSVISRIGQNRVPKILHYTIQI